ncbi:MAG: caspase family protein [Ignavibacteriales bacterium]
MMRKALIVGINLYLPPAGPNLRGCVNDAQNVAYTLNTLGIVPAEPKSMRILTDARATKANILNQLEWLTKDTSKGDVLIYYHSSHGTQVADMEGDDIDQKDEALCPYDVARNGVISDGVIKDDDLNKIFSKIPEGVTLDVIIDSCHSGNINRTLEFCTPEIEANTRTPRYMEPMLDFDFFLRANPLIPKQKILRGREQKKEVAIAETNNVLWAACRDNQISNENIFEGKFQGAFTFCYCKLLRKYYSEGITREKLDTLVGQALYNLGEPQIPQLEGIKEKLEKKVFT